MTLEGSALQRASALIAHVHERPPQIAVIGDLILDSWWLGSAEGVTREAPAPVIRLDDVIDVAGGAANSAANLRALGAEVRAVGVIGRDSQGERLLAAVERAGLDTAAIIRTTAETTIKTRVVAGDSVMLRIDSGFHRPSDNELEQLAAAAVRAAEGADAVLVCDYGSGILRQAVEHILALARPGLLVIDAHKLANWAFARAELVTPNAQEAERLLGSSLGRGGARVAAVRAAAETLRERSGARQIVITLDSDGAMALDADDSLTRTFAQPAEEKQASGAGDTFTATATLALAAGRSLATAVDLAQAAADVVVQRPGTSVCTADDLLTSLAAPAAAVLDEDTLVEVLAEQSHRGRRIVFTNGCFDVLHRGHTSYLRQARELGDVLVVAVNNDNSVRQLKGEGRPINPEGDRAGVIAELGCVDYVTLFGGDTAIPLLERIRPDIYVKGGDYAPDMLAEAATVRSYGGTVTTVGYVSEHSTTDMVRRIRSAAS
ncbi:D-glycero-beta-D-manno-heptose 1-phosphate adenylyltransferase [Rathayibacter toxicus]|uniref:D-glycero-beta-D-manno-heptose 1-phosphate adenylyltransferase n=1 Tax=Rathayibacter toxicus TaxID=145458 RepID=UPI001C03FB99|nr:D-glycero-beta-D-manno-heptose 1-phosphate adenylyltransferase [Rathayibacter toxicus]QWL32679.1 D-glycero-beta-D-manno-heptose 1-phosphate adenylyltransferase [Rathayibacter toxicus]QWL34774.1 D-glycero-beta-D-manno-heptose 1-phosphate adenylyltransferase [Rathayibacter toxicus]QWL36905.1 D-glycero-beta-D-manno-heptose 1-phosphate adenylyltransferase [Rathayibacter toxicus]QWL38997.1 D-glycero-beta-D-manno-heptose 1-phosphate adenylyltransferase [Rathayibacter toxicus]QWL41083.1 D-glycero-